MTLLYLTEDYFASKVHNNLLIQVLDHCPNLHIYVFSPIRDKNRTDLSDSFRHNERLTVISPFIDISLKLYKFDYWAKIRSKLRLIEQNLPIQDIDIVHAATLYSEGGVALSLKQKYGIPYLLSIRGTDAKFYTNKMFHLWITANRIIRHSKIVTCVTFSIRNKMIGSLQYLPMRKKMMESLIINNGIDHIWIDNLYKNKRNLHDKIRILFIGRFDENKNILSLIDAVLRMNKKNEHIQLTMIGGRGPVHNQVLKLVDENDDSLEYLGEIYNKHELIQIARKCDVFAMVSHRETFGLVYAECLSQGLPLLYTLGTGFDGMYPQGKIGYGVNSRSVKSIMDGLWSIKTHYERLQNNMRELDFKRYSWFEIAKTYLDIYNTIYEK